jgi:hypothetical protein
MSISVFPTRTTYEDWTQNSILLSPCRDSLRDATGVDLTDQSESKCGIYIKTHTHLRSVKFTSVSRDWTELVWCYATLTQHPEVNHIRAISQSLSAFQPVHPSGISVAVLLPWNLWHCTVQLQPQHLTSPLQQQWWRPGTNLSWWGIVTKWRMKGSSLILNLHYKRLTNDRKWYLNNPLLHTKGYFTAAPSNVHKHDTQDDYERWL